MGRGIVSVKRTDLPQRSYSQKVETWLQVHGGEWDKRDDITEQRGYLRSGGVAVSRKNQHPQLECKRNLQLSGAMVPRKQVKQTSCPAWGARLMFDPIMW